MKCAQFQLKAGAQASKVGPWKAIIGCKSKAKKKNVYRSERIPFLSECVVFRQERGIFSGVRKYISNYLRIFKQYPLLGRGSK